GERAALLRCLLHRRLSDPARRRRGGQGLGAALFARRTRLSAPSSELIASGRSAVPTVIRGLDPRISKMAGSSPAMTNKRADQIDRKATVASPPPAGRASGLSLAAETP